MPLKTQSTIRRSFITVTLLIAAACSSTPVPPTATPIVITTTPIPRTPVPTFERLETPTPTPLPTEPLIVRDALTGAADTLYIRPKPSTMADIADTVDAATAFDYIGRTDDDRWLQVSYGDSQSGWLLARSVTLPFAVDDAAGHRHCRERRLRRAGLSASSGWHHLLRQPAQRSRGRRPDSSAHADPPRRSP